MISLNGRMEFEDVEESNDGGLDNLFMVIHSVA